MESATIDTEIEDRNRVHWVKRIEQLEISAYGSLYMESATIDTEIEDRNRVHWVKQIKQLEISTYGSLYMESATIDTEIEESGALGEADLATGNSKFGVRRSGG